MITPSVRMLFDDELIQSKVETPKSKVRRLCDDSTVIFKIFNHLIFLFMEMQFYYDNKIVKLHLRDHCFLVVGMLVGLHWPLCFFSNITDGISWLSYGRLRPLHLWLFCLCRNMFAGILFYSALKARMFSDFLSNLISGDGN
jgi:cbb3-type cytochrome oxidase subunit 1